MSGLMKTWGNNLLDFGNRILAPIDKRIERSYLAVVILLITCSSKWIFEGLLAFAELQVLFIMIGIGLIILKRKSLRPMNSSGIWILYIISIFFSVLISGGNLNIWGRALLSALTVAYMLYLGCDDFNVKKAIELLCKIGIFHALMVIVHFLFNEQFTKLYLPLLNPIDYDYAIAYSEEGYYFGLLHSPHEVAGLIVFSIFSIVYWNLSQKKVDKRLYVLAAALLFPLFLTGKKGVLFCALASLGICIVAELIIHKNWRALKFFLGVSVLVLIVLVVLIICFPEVKIFYRLNLFLTKLISGKSVDATRKSLYKNAINLWKEQPLFGVGWRQFKDMTTGKLGYRLAHQVNCDYLQWLCELGIVGFVLNIAPVAVTLWRALIIWKDGLVHITDSTTKWIVWFALNTQLFILLYAFVEIPFYDITFFSIYIFSCLIINDAYGKLKKGKILLYKGDYL